MSLFNFFSSSDKDVGGEVLQAYFDEAVKFPEFGFGTYDAWLISLQTKVSDILDVVGGLVNANSASTSVAQSKTRMAQLASDSGGQATIPQIVAASGGQGDTVNWMQAVPEIASDSIKDLGTTVQTVGQGLLSTLSLTKYLPFILLGGVALYIGIVAQVPKKLK